MMKRKESYIQAQRGREQAPTAVGNNGARQETLDTVNREKIAAHSAGREAQRTD